jgi:hypothetical protein
VEKYLDIGAALFACAAATFLVSLSLWEAATHRIVWGKTGTPPDGPSMWQ